MQTICIFPITKQTGNQPGNARNERSSQWRANEWWIINGGRMWCHLEALRMRAYAAVPCNNI